MEYLPWAAVGLGLVAVALAVVSLVTARRANRRVNEVTPDVRGLAQRVREADAEGTLSAIFSQIEGMTRRVDQVHNEVGDLNRIVSRSLRRVGLVRYDSNDEIRGNLSFALCLLDNRDNGVMLTSVYDLDNCRVFVRGILGGKTQHDLMPEEAEALRQALGEP
jgi:hypothetical protein